MTRSNLKCPSFQSSQHCAEQVQLESRILRVTLAPVHSTSLRSTQSHLSKFVATRENHLCSCRSSLLLPSKHCTASLVQSVLFATCDVLLYRVQMTFAIYCGSLRELRVGGGPRKTAIITGTVPIKPHNKGVESVWGVRVRRLSPCQVDRHLRMC